MSTPDLTIVVLCGRSSVALHATLSSIERAARQLCADEGARLETLLLPGEGSPVPRDGLADIADRIGLRRLDAAPRAEACRMAMAMAEAQGTFVARLDAGDIWSGNFLHVAMSATRREGSRHSVWRPEAVIDSGRDFHAYDVQARIQSPLDGALDGASLLYASPYAPSFLAHRAVVAAAPLPVADRQRGWLDVDAWWIAECLAAGHAQRILEGTVLYRWDPSDPLSSPVRIGPSRLFLPPVAERMRQ